MTEIPVKYTEAMSDNVGNGCIGTYEMVHTVWKWFLSSLDNDSLLVS